MLKTLLRIQHRTRNTVIYLLKKNNLPLNIDLVQLNKHFQYLSKKYHPGKSTKNTEKIKEIQEDFVYLKKYLDSYKSA